MSKTPTPKERPMTRPPYKTRHDRKDALPHVCERCGQRLPGPDTRHGTLDRGVCTEEGWTR